MCSAMPDNYYISANIICCLNIYIYLYISIWAPVKILYICYGYRFWGGSLSRVLWKSAYSRSNMKPKSIPKQARKWIQQLFRWFQVLRQLHVPFVLHLLHTCSFMFLSFACIFLSLCIQFLSCCLPIPWSYNSHLARSRLPPGSQSTLHPVPPEIAATSLRQHLVVY